MKRIAIFICMTLLLGKIADAQYIIEKDNSRLEISGLITMYYQHLGLKEGFTDQSKNSFYLKDAEIQLEGKAGKKFRYQIEFDLSDLASGSDDPEDPGLSDAWFQYDGLKFVDIKAGYQKLPYSRGARVSFAYSPFFKRSEVARGEFFAARDLGITLIRKFWQDRILVSAGVYSGSGELSLTEHNDVKGNPLFSGRAEFHYPYTLKYRDIDVEHSSIPAFTIGVNGQYANKQAGTPAPFELRVINGEKTSFGFDVFAVWNGFTAGVEADRIMMKPNNKSDLLGYNTDFYRAGGWYGFLTWHFLPANSYIAARYEEFNRHDLVKGYSQRCSFAYGYMLKKFDSIIKLNFTYAMKDETLPGAGQQKWKWQAQAGWQLMFN